MQVSLGRVAEPSAHCGGRKRHRQCADFWFPGPAKSILDWLYCLASSIIRLSQVLDVVKGQQEASLEGLFLVNLAIVGRHMPVRRVILRCRLPSKSNCSTCWYLAVRSAALSEKRPWKLQALLGYFATPRSEPFLRRLLLPHLSQV